MRILVDLPADDIRWLDAAAKDQGRSRAAVIRDAVSFFIRREEKAGIEKYFGLWERHGSKVDGLEYERRLRDEWPDVVEVDVSKKRDAA